ncbi:MAG: four helix bundle protein [Legionellaceae bacterium]|nr:four helix bundle protein [Legionellaceae bacterium]
MSHTRHCESASHVRQTSKKSASVESPSSALWAPFSRIRGEGDKEKFFGRHERMAKRSGTETAAILDVAKRLDIIHEDHYQKGRELLIRIIMMLTKLAQKSD